MKELNLPNFTLMAVVTSCFIQFGAQLFALTIIASTVAEAPPRSFAMFEGEYGYDSSAFWSTVPPITFLLLVIALITNWKTRRRKLLLLAGTLFIIGGLVAGLYLEPLFAEMIAKGYSEEVNPVLQSRAARWYAIDWMVWGLGVLAGLALLLALIMPVTTLQHARSMDKD
jgi:hypothetical protein